MGVDNRYLQPHIFPYPIGAHFRYALIGNYPSNSAEGVLVGWVDFGTDVEVKEGDSIPPEYLDVGRRVIDITHNEPLTGDEES